MSESLQEIVKAISDLSETEMGELFKILHLNKCEYTKNNNGIFINLSWQKEGILDIIEKYIHFCQQSRKEVSKYQSMCDILNKKLEKSRELENKLLATDFVNDMDEGAAAVADTAGATLANPEQVAMTASRVSSSMKFYLLKKKYAKLAPNDYGIGIADVLDRESYLIN